MFRSRFGSSCKCKSVGLAQGVVAMISENQRRLMEERVLAMTKSERRELYIGYLKRKSAERAAAKMKGPSPWITEIQRRSGWPRPRPPPRRRRPK
eukprot:2951771-Alexandrium_andersonii.AAC.1